MRVGQEGYPDKQSAKIIKVSMLRPPKSGLAAKISAIYKNNRSHKQKLSQMGGNSLKCVSINCLPLLGMKRKFKSAKGLRTALTLYTTMDTVVRLGGNETTAGGNDLLEYWAR